LRQVDDQTIERGDIVVTEERARLLSQPRTDAQGRPVNLDPTPPRPGVPARGPTAAPAASPAASATAPAAAAAKLPASASPAAVPPAAVPPAEEDRSKRKVRAVGPAFYPVR
jgi:hypothetical protein